MFNNEINFSELNKLHCRQILNKIKLDFYFEIHFKLENSNRRI